MNRSMKCVWQGCCKEHTSGQRSGSDGHCGVEEKKKRCYIKAGKMFQELLGILLSE